MHKITRVIISLFTSIFIVEVIIAVMYILQLSCSDLNSFHVAFPGMLLIVPQTLFGLIATIIAPLLITILLYKKVFSDKKSFISGFIIIFIFFFINFITIIPYEFSYKIEIPSYIAKECRNWISGPANCYINKGSKHNVSIGRYIMLKLTSDSKKSSCGGGPAGPLN